MCICAVVYRNVLSLAFPSARRGVHYQHQPIIHLLLDDGGGQGMVTLVGV